MSRGYCGQCGDLYSDEIECECQRRTGMSKWYRTFVEGDRVKFQVGGPKEVNQTFTLDYDPEDEKDIDQQEALEWMRQMLDKGLSRLAKGEQE